VWARWTAWRDRAQRSRFGRNALTIARANLVAQALPLLAAPLLTRLYSPADFGTLALFVATLGVIQAVSNGRFDWSVPNARSAGMAAALLALGVGVLAVVMVAVIAGPWWWGRGAMPLPGALPVALCAAPAPPPPWWAAGGIGHVLLAMSVLGGGLQQLVQSWHVRCAELSALGRAKVMQSIANVAVALLFAAALAGLPGWRPSSPVEQALGLLAGVVAGAWFGLPMLWRRAAGLQQALRRLTTRRLAVAWIRFRHEAAWSTLVTAVNTASFAVIPLLLARHWSVAEVGWYALMQRVALAPIGLVGSAVSQSFWAEAARLVREDRPALARLYRRSSWRLVWVALPICAAALAGPWLIAPLFGAEWEGAGWVLAASVPMLFGQVVASPLSHLVVHGRQHWQAAWDLARIAALALTIEAAGRAGLGIVATVASLSTAMAAMYLVLIALNLRALR
jgi:O-antigen/teichoic acid export membrane protein